MSRQFPKISGIGRRSPYPLRQRRLEAGETVYEMGNSNGYLYRVVSGTVFLSSPRRGDGLDPIELGTGEVFGQAGLFSGTYRREFAIAATEVVLDVMERADALKLLEHHDERMRALIAELFVQAEQRMTTPPAAEDPKSPAESAEEATGVQDTVDETTPVKLLLMPSSRPLGAWIGRDPIEITQLPFVVGREGEGEDDRSNDQIDLVLADEKPYQLSRQHFVIDTHEGELVIRDSGSYHGTTVNKQRIGNARITNIVPLRFGENRIVAGSTDSPYCFTLLIEAA